MNKSNLHVHSSTHINREMALSDLYTLANSIQHYYLSESEKLLIENTINLLVNKVRFERLKLI